jgi:hypothetical protein
MVSIGLAVVVAAVVAVIIVIRLQPLMADGFDQPNGLITNEFAYFNPGNPASVVSPTWIVTSGSLFAHNGSAWTGIPDVGPTGAKSATSTDSAVFRVVTRRADFQDVTVSFSLLIQRFVTGPGGQQPQWQGVHVFLRYQNPNLLYVVSVDRRDGVIVMKKKVPGGTVNGGTYYTLATLNSVSVYGQWEQVRVSAVNNNEGGVELRLWLNNRLRLQGIDNGVGDVPPITQPGRVGIRGDYTEFKFDNFTVNRA